DTPRPTALYTLSLHDALPIWAARPLGRPGSSPVPHALPLHDLYRYRRLPGYRAVAAATARDVGQHRYAAGVRAGVRRGVDPQARSEEHTSELQSLRHLVCRLL